VTRDGDGFEEDGVPATAAGRVEDSQLEGREGPLASTAGDNSTQGGADGSSKKGGLDTVGRKRKSVTYEDGGEEGRAGGDGEEERKDEAQGGEETEAEEARERVKKKKKISFEDYKTMTEMIALFLRAQVR